MGENFVSGWLRSLISKKKKKIEKVGATFRMRLGTEEQWLQKRTTKETGY